MGLNCGRQLVETEGIFFLAEYNEYKKPLWGDIKPDRLKAEKEKRNYLIKVWLILLNRTQ